MEEPSVLDYVKSKLTPWRGQRVEIPPEPGEDAQLPVEPIEKAPRQPFVWRPLAALGLALVAQRLLEPPDRSVPFAIAFYVLAAAILIWALIRGELRPAEIPAEANGEMSDTIRQSLLLLSLPLTLLAFMAFGGNLFTPLNLLLWLAALVCLVAGLWERGENAWWTRIRQAWKRLRQQPILQITLTPWMGLVFLALVLAFFFRFYLLREVPVDMFSDHAEKLLDVSDVINGRYSIFFQRNTGREAIQMYLTAAIALIGKTGLTYISLKIGTALAGFLTLPFIYLLGKEIANKRVGLLAFVLAGMAYWPNIISRVGLRFPLYPLFAAPALYFLIRGLRHQRRNDFILSGLCLGLGLHGYSPFRFVPIVVFAAVLIYLLHAQSRGKRKQTTWALILLAIVTLVVFLPLFRTLLADPQIVLYRMMTRMGTTEAPYPGSPWMIFLNNFWKCSIMPFYDNGGVWVNSIIGRPALDVVTAALFFLGLVIVLVRYIRQRNWLDLFLLLSIPLLMMPSILALAFPNENPSLNRAGGAYIPIFILAAIAFEAILTSLAAQVHGQRMGWVWVGLLLFGLLGMSANQNYDLIFNQYAQQYRQTVWNTGEMGQVAHEFATLVGTPDTTYVVPFPYWVDTRLVGMTAGYPLKDYALSKDRLADPVRDPRAKLYLVKEEDAETLGLLQQLYPTGSFRLYPTQRNGMAFWLYYVPAQPGASAAP